MYRDTKEPGGSVVGIVKPVQGRPRRRRTLRISRTIAVAATAACAELCRAAPALFLDVNGGAPGSGVVAGTEYTWDATSTLWSSDPAGASAAVTTWNPAATLVLSAGTDATSTFVVRVRSSQSAAGIDVEEGNPTLTNISGTVTINGGPLNVADGRTLSINAILASTSPLHKTGAGTLVLVHTLNTFSGGIIVSGGVLQYGGENILSGSGASRTGYTPSAPVPDYLRLDGGTIRDTSTATAATLLNQNKGILLDSAGGTIDISDASPTNTHAYRGVITGPGSLTKTGPGMLLLGPAASTYAGATSVAQGAIKLGGNDALPATTALSLPSTGSMLDMGGFNQTVASLSGTGKIINSGRLTVTPASAQSFAGVISGGGGLTVDGSAFLTLAAVQTYTGPTRLSGASAAPFGIRLGTAGALSAAEVEFNATGPGAAPTLDLNGFSQTFARIINVNPGVGSPSITNTAATPATLTLTAATTTTIPVPITGSISLVKTGPSALVLSASNSYLGPTRIAAGTLGVSHPAQIGDGGAANGIILEAGAVLRADASFATSRTLVLQPTGGTINTNGSHLTLSGAIIGPGTLTKIGPGSLSITAQTMPPLTITAGEVRLIAGSGTVKIGTLTAATGRLDLASNRAVFTSLTPAALAGLLAAGRTLAGNWEGTAGIASSTAAADPFQTTAVGYATAGQLGISAWESVADIPAGHVVSRLTSYGDVNLDGILNGDDFARIDLSLARGIAPGSALWFDGDFNYDRAVTVADYMLMDRALLRRSQGLTAGFLADRESRFGGDYLSQLFSTIPEPSFALAAPLVFLGRRRRLP